MIDMFCNYHVGSTPNQFENSNTYEKMVADIFSITVETFTYL